MLPLNNSESQISYLHAGRLAKFVENMQRLFNIVFILLF